MHALVHCVWATAGGIPLSLSPFFPSPLKKSCRGGSTRPFFSSTHRLRPLVSLLVFQTKLWCAPNLWSQAQLSLSLSKWWSTLSPQPLASINPQPHNPTTPQARLLPSFSHLTCKATLGCGSRLQGYSGNPPSALLLLFCIFILRSIHPFALDALCSHHWVCHCP